MDFTDVIYLEDEDFSNKELKLKGLVIIFIFASWCGHCKNAHPEYQKFANEMKNNKNITIACIQSDGKREGEQLISKKLPTLIEGFRGFPTIVAFKDGKYVGTLSGSRNEKGFLDFAKKYM
jgi:thiol-disulfide isomerase/thioredoxin